MACEPVVASGFARRDSQAPHGTDSRRAQHGSALVRGCKDLRVFQFIFTVLVQPPCRVAGVRPRPQRLSPLLILFLLGRGQDGGDQ
jgi:hypothetical protein